MCLYVFVCLSVEDDPWAALGRGRLSSTASNGQAEKPLPKPATPSSESWRFGAKAETPRPRKGISSLFPSDFHRFSSIFHRFFMDFSWISPFLSSFETFEARREACRRPRVGGVGFRQALHASSTPSFNSRRNRRRRRSRRRRPRRQAREGKRDGKETRKWRERRLRLRF